MIAYYISFGPHSARQPESPNETRNVILGTLGVVAFSIGLSYVIQSNGQERPHTLTKEWQEKTEEYLRSQNADPITGISSK